MEKIFNTALQARTREYMETSSTSQAELARRLGMTNSSTLSRWLKSAYSGDVEKVERSLEHVQAPGSFQFMRQGYFCADNRDSTQEHPVFNRSVSLKDGFKRKS